MKSSITEHTSVSLTSHSEELKGLLVSYGDDHLQTVTAEFEKQTDKTFQKLDLRKRLLENLTFSGIDIHSTDEMKFMQ